MEKWVSARQLAQKTLNVWKCPQTGLTKSGSIAVDAFWKDNRLRISEAVMNGDFETHIFVRKDWHKSHTCRFLKRQGYVFASSWSEEDPTVLMKW
jgi:hypothetical protein